MDVIYYDTTADHDHNQASVGHGELSMYLNAITEELSSRSLYKEEENRGTKLDRVLPMLSTFCLRS